MTWKRADELTEDDTILETWSEGVRPQKIYLEIFCIEREDERVTVTFMTARSFTYDADELVEVVDAEPFVRT